MNSSPPESGSLPSRTIRLLTERLAQFGQILESEAPFDVAQAVRNMEDQGLLGFLEDLPEPAQSRELSGGPGLTDVEIELECTRMKLERLQAGREMQTESLAQLNHDVRGLMTTFLGMLELLRHTKVDEEQVDHLDTMDGAARSVLRILGDSLEFAKLENSSLDLFEEPVNPHHLFEAVSRFYRPRAKETGLELKVSVDKSLPDSIEMDEVRLRQILGNLLENAIKFTKEGHVELKVQAISADQFTVEVIDTGMGIAREHLAEIFLPYVQSRAEDRSHEGRGVGLGLAIVKKLTDLMGGTISATSQRGEGAHFKVTLPLKSLVQEPITIEELPAAEKGSRQTVLVVEDDPLNQKFMLSTARRLGYDVDLACNGEEAVAMASSNLYDAILMDIAMPVMDGMEATRLIRSLQTPQGETRIIAVTGHVFEKDRRNYRNAGMDGFLAKPFGMKDLRAVLDA